MRAPLVILCGLLATGAQSETISVRSGQHDSFTRLVLTLPEGRQWQLGRSGADYMLDLGNDVDTFDVSEVFSRIETNRIAELVPSRGKLTIALACSDCHADAFLWRPDRLVVDIVDGPPPAESEFEAALRAIDTQEQDRLQTRLPVLFDREDERVREPLISGTYEIEPTSNLRVREAERAIIESLARAASQGVFASPSRTVPLAPDQLTEGEPGSDSAGPPTLVPVTDPMDGVPATFSHAPEGDGPGLVLRTSIERGEDAQTETNQTGQHCIGNELVSLHDWGDERSFSEQLSEKKIALTSEFDAFIPNAIEDLARTYLFFGFGSEALQVLSLDGQRSLERRVLMEMAQIVDGLPPADGLFEDQVDCESFVSLWAALSAQSLSAVSQDGRSAIVMAFRLLPASLQAHLGPDLAGLFLDAGDAETADTLLTITRHSDAEASIQHELVSSEVVRELQGRQAAIEDLGAMVVDDVRMPPEALVQLIELMLAEGQAVGDSILTLAEAMRFEMGETEIAGRLALAEIGAHTANSDFDIALGLAQDAATPITELARTVAINSVFQGMVEREQDPAFLEVVFSPLPERLEPTTENHLAERLIGMGFPERALEILQGPAVQEAMAERRYLRATAAADLGDLAGVEIALSGLSDARANAVRARAFAAAGDYESALEQGNGIDQMSVDLTEAWRAGAWAVLENADDPLLQSASRAVLQDVPAPDQPITLAQRLNLLDQAAQTRLLSEELLGRFAVPPNE